MSGGMSALTVYKLGGPALEDADLLPALALAVALRASALVYLSDVDGVRLDGEAAEWLDAETARREMTRGAIAGGMAMKVETALQAVAAGVPEVIVAGKARLLGGFGGTHVRTDAAAGARA